LNRAAFQSLFEPENKENDSSKDGKDDGNATIQVSVGFPPPGSHFRLNNSNHNIQKKIVMMAMQHLKEHCMEAPRRRQSDVWRL